jgi:hypothetical protein
MVNTYQGISRTLAHFGMPLAIPFMAMAAASGFAQVASIKKQAIPSAAVGAWLPQDTLVQAHREETILPPVDKSPVVQEMLGKGQPIHLHIYGYDGRKIKDMIVDTVNRSEDIKIDLRKVQ